MNIRETALAALEPVGEFNAPRANTARASCGNEAKRKLLPELAVQIIDHARQQCRVTMGDTIKVTGASRNTLKEHFRHLLDQGRFEKHGAGKGTSYVLS